MYGKNDYSVLKEQLMFTVKIVKKIEEDFQVKRPLLEGRADKLFKVFESASPEEVICLKYLYSYLPLSDCSSYDGELFLNLVRDSLLAKERFPWGKDLSDEMFFNYVLSVRINNEDLTDHRGIIREELSDRIEGLSMADAALEINLWTYEKATYQATDGRTISPLTIMKRAFGRCGEESTFLVSALRSVALPARQIYTPRWAASDDNHAWVEVWTGDKWEYLGACEPEAILNKGWFSAPARRGMIMQTRLHTGFVADEEVTQHEGNYYNINVSKTYFDPANLKVIVKNEGQKLENSRIDLNVINYAQISPITSLRTDKNGQISVNVGRGDLILRAFPDIEKYPELKNKTIETKISLLEGDKEVIVDFSDSNQLMLKQGVVHYYMTAPKSEINVDPEATPEAEMRMQARKKEAEAIREAYQNSFYKDPDGDNAKQYNKESLEYRKAKVLAQSLGNKEEIEKFLNESETGLCLEYKLDLLEILRWKDLSDITFDILLEHAVAAKVYKKDFDKDIFVENVLNPRVSNEMLRAWRGLANVFSDEEIADFKDNPLNLVQFLDKKVETLNQADSGGMANPLGVLEMGKGSALSKILLIIASMRSLGIPARLNPTDRHPEFYKNGEWHGFEIESYKAEVNNDSDVASRLGKNKDNEVNINLRRSGLLVEKNNDEAIEYMTQIAFSRIEADGNLSSLFFKDFEFDANNEFYVDIEPGKYQVLLCKRSAQGNNEAYLYRTEVKDNELTRLKIDLPEAADLDQKQYNLLTLDFADGSEFQGSEDLNFLAILEPAAEPTEHFFNELLEADDRFENLSSRTTFVLSDNEAEADPKLKSVLDRFSKITLKKVSDKVDINKYVEESFKNYDLHNLRLPLLLLVNDKQEVVRAISGYQVGSVVQVLQEIKER